MHAVDLIRKTRDGETLSPEEIRFLVAGAAEKSIPEEQLSAWLMAVFQRGITLPELASLTEAMRHSGDTFDARDLGKPTVDKHSTGGVGDKTSLIVAPIAAAAGLLDPMISGRALGHTGGTLDKLESIPGFRTDLSLTEMRSVLETTGAALVGQTERLVPADRTLYALRDRTATVESPFLICASIMSKKLAAGLDALVLDVKTGSGAFLRDPKQSRFLAELLVETGERSGTRTAAILSDMSQPLGETAGNFIEVAECCTLLRGERPRLSEDLRQLSLLLAGWMLHLGGIAATPEQGQQRAEELLSNGQAWNSWQRMVEAQGGDPSVLHERSNYHRPGATATFTASKAGYIAEIDTSSVGWAVQRLGAGRSKAGEPVDPHAGLRMCVKLGDRVEKDQPVATLYATSPAHLEEPQRLLSDAIHIAAEKPEKLPPLVSDILTRETLATARK